jgi:hypothetical protein
VEQPETGGIRATVSGDVSGQVAVGTAINQTQVSGAVDPPSAAELEELRGEIASLKALIQAEAPPEIRASAMERVDELEESLVAKEPNVSAIEYLKGWFGKHLPRVAGAITGILLHPVVGKIVRAAGEAVAGEYGRRVGEPHT